MCCVPPKWDLAKLKLAYYYQTGHHPHVGGEKCPDMFAFSILYQQRGYSCRHYAKHMLEEEQHQ